MVGFGINVSCSRGTGAYDAHSRDSSPRAHLPRGNTRNSVRWTTPSG
jgi:hypothetical protein